MFDTIFDMDNGTFVHCLRKPMQSCHVRRSTWLVGMTCSICPLVLQLRSTVTRTCRMSYTTPSIRRPPWHISLGMWSTWQRNELAVSAATLVKTVAECFARVRLHHLGKCETEKAVGTNVRKKLTKLILFKHQ